MSAVPEVYPQIRGMFEKALRGMAEGETEAEKQIVYVLNEARAALPCPSFVAVPGSGSPSGRGIYAMLNRAPVEIVSVDVTGVPGQFAIGARYDTPRRTAAGTLALAGEVARALKLAYTVIMQAATEAGPIMALASRTGAAAQAEALGTAGSEKPFAGIPFHPDGILVPPGAAQCSPPVIGPQPPPKPLDDVLAEMRARLAELNGHLKDTPAYDYKEVLNIVRILDFAEQQRRTVLL